MRRCAFCDSPVPADATVCPVCKEEIAEETLERLLPLLKRPEAPEVRSMSPVERLWGIIRRPAPTYRDIGQKPDGAGPFIIILLNALLMAGLYIAVSSKFTVTIVVNATLGTTADVSVFQTPAGGTFMLAALISLLPNMLLGFVYLIIGSAFAHLAFKITGGTGDKLRTLSIVGYSMLPVVIVRAISIIVVLTTMPAYDVNAQSAWADVITLVYESRIWQTIDLMTTASFFWVGLLLVFGIREAHDTSTVWAVLVSIAVMLVLGWTFWQAH